MEKDRISRYFFIGILFLLLYIAFLMFKPFITPTITAVILTFITHPLYVKLDKKVKNRSLSAALMILIIVLLLIIPSIFIFKTLMVETTNTINFLHEVNSNTASSDYLVNLGVEKAQVGDLVKELLNKFSSVVVSTASSFLGSLPEKLIGLFVFFFVMYYGFKEGETLYKSIENYIPLKQKHREKLLKKVQDVSHAVLYGQVLTAIVQGTIGGIGFFIFGLPNPVFWGYVMIILSFLPIIGTPIIWGPAGIIEIAMGNYFSGIGILIYGGLLVMNIDNFLKPYLISDRAQLHPLLILLGVLGGLVVFGFAGIVLGPLVVALLITMIEFYMEEKSFVV